MCQETMDSTNMTKFYIQSDIVARDTLVEVDLQGFTRLLQVVSCNACQRPGLAEAAPQAPEAARAGREHR
jgi:hypothetical protein